MPKPSRPRSQSSASSRELIFSLFGSFYRVMSLLTWDLRRFACAGFGVAALILAALASTGCSGPSGPGAAGSGQSHPSGSNTCATPTAGCACTESGKTAACGSVVSREGTHVECSEGTTTCSEGIWGACIGEKTHTMTVPLTRPGLSLQNVTPTATNCSDDPCDPYCQTYNDTPTGFDAGTTGITTTDAGVSLTGVVSHMTTCTGFTVTPTTETLTVTQIPAIGSIVYTASPVSSAQYTSALTPSSCYTGTPPTIWTVDNPSISTISATGALSLVSPIATTFHVVGYSGGWTNSATPSTVNVVVNAVDVSNAPSGYTNASFTGTATTADNITVLYPYNGTVLPLGLPAPTIQWAGANAFTISAVAASGLNAKITTSAAHGLATGASVTITGALGDTVINGTFTVTVTSTTQFTIPVTPLGTYTASSATGWQTANAVRVQLRYPAGSGSLFTWSGILPENETQPTPSLPGVPRALIPQNVWNALAQTAVGQTVDIVIQRIVGGVLLKPNTPVNLTFATGQLKGTVYYQSYGTNLVTNFCCTQGGASFGGATLGIQPGATAPTVVAGTSSQCVVCHSVSSSGANLTTQSGGNYSETVEYNLSNLAQTAISPYNGIFAWAALSSDGSYLFSNSGGLYSASSTNSALYNVPSGSSISVTGLPAIQATSPSFSTDNAHVAFNFFGGTVSGHTGDQASLASIDYNHAGQAFSNFQVLATPGSGGVGASGNQIYYPSYLPSNNQMVWELQTISNGRGGELNDAETRSQCDQNGPVACQNDGTHAELWWTDVASKTSAKLNNLNGGTSGGGTYLPPHPTALLPAGDDQLNYEPTVNPQVTGGYAWVVFTSRRLYGNIATINPYWSDPRYQNISVEPTTKKLWVAAINPNAAPGTDPSYPAFYLPGQELLAGNSRGYWVLNQCEAAGTTSASLCTSNLDCCSPSVCSLDAPPATTAHCASSASASCAANGAACSTSSQCCSFPNSVCAQSVCTPAQTITYSPSQFTVDYAGTSCPPGDLVSWVDVGIEALTPASGGTNSSIGIGVQTSGVVGGTTATTYAPTVPVNVGTLSGPPANQSATWTNFALSTALSSISSSAGSQPFLQVTFSLKPTTDQAAAPTVVDWRVRFDCVPAQ